MPFLVEIKKKIGSVQNTRKITKAMELVAASRMKQFQRKALSARSYARNLLEVLRADEVRMDELIYGEQREHGAVLFVLLTSDKGLCGSLNQQLLRSLWSGDRWKAIPDSERLLMTVGRKGHEAAAYAGVTPIARFDGLPERLSVIDVLPMISVILGYWERKEVREVILIAPHYVNPFTFHTTQKTYLPLSAEMAGTHLEWSTGSVAPTESPARVSVEWQEPDRGRVAQALAHQLIEMLFVQAFYELKATEYSSRMVAMKNATEAADDLVQTLTLSYNKARQSAITQQLAELTGGALAVEE